MPFVIQSNLSDFEMQKVYFLKIFTNNILVCVFAISGLFLFRIPAFLVYLINPLVLGFILALNWVSTGELIYFLYILLPHSVFEIPAIVMSCSLGMKGKRDRREIKQKIFLFELLLITMLLIIAAIIESTVSIGLT
ncbi:stage II sporulation protein M [Acetitomaculum ruminis]|uniref:stage II sporulation protein M n=1 Tax=Acetitomaculum ruminis TaxID=2382 RepID=UPI000B89BE5F|nr:stage II sporulation protein M [Acetitomaculum ruminis]